MNSDRRHNSRMPIEIDAVLNYQASAVICTVRDISVTGAFLEASPEDLPYSGNVELALTVSSEGKSRSFRLPAVVTRVTESGVGVSFSDVNQDAYFGLVDLVFPRQPTSSPAAVEAPVARFKKP
ncbi:MAG: PilZ domain-containing protein [Pseudomonadota bacterium]|nr:MAG: PilZ domain-containing protein [Pseudomonadota bacterium]